jgi:hypothetical protein
MKISRAIGALGLWAAAASAALQPGDIAFTGFNSSGADNLAFVTFKDIPAGDTLRFCDSEWNGTAFGTDEGDFAWVATSPVPAGTVITIDSLGSGTTRASTGAVPAALDNSGGLGNTDEAMFVFSGSGPRAPAVFLAAVGTRATAFHAAPATGLTGTGLAVGSSAILLKTDINIGAYVGPRSGLTQAQYLAALNDSTYWITQDAGSGDHVDGVAPDWPFSAAAFAFGAGPDTVKPAVTNVTVTSATVLTLTFSEPLDSASAVNTANYALNPVLAFSAAAYDKAQRKVTLAHAAFAVATSYTLQVTGVKDTADNTMAAYASAPLSFSPVLPAIAFEKAYYTVKESQSLMNVRLTVTGAPSDSATVLIQVAAGGTAVAGTDFAVSADPFGWPKDSSASRRWTIAITPNASAQPDRFFVLELKSPTNATLGAASRTIVYILDDDTQAPAKSGELDLKFVSSFKAADSGSAEIAAYDPKSKRLFVMNSIKDKLEILNFRNPRAISKIASIDLAAFGAGGTSVASHNGLVAVTIDAPNQQPGKVVFLDTNGTVLKNVTVGSLPDMVTFSPDGKLVLTANEGQPSSDYTQDPEGSVSVIDLSGGIAGLSQSNVTTMTFNAFDAQKPALVAQGVRIFGAHNATVSKDLEPEYVTVSEDSKTAWITLQENNAIARADLTAKAITNIFPLGLKDHSLARNTFDASDRLDSTVFMGAWPVKGVYMPDAIANLKVGDTTYVFTANEGDAREYSALVEEKKAGDAAYKLDSATFPNAAILKLESNLGRLAVTGSTGDTDGDGDYDQIHAFGARSFSVWNAATGAQVWDSGNELELVTAKDSAYGRLFNASNDNTTFKNRSDNKGPEPEGIALAKIGAKHYAFIALERTGGVVAYEVTHPKAPRFVAYANNRTPVSTTNDLGSEGIIFIPRASSPNDTALVVLANEVSATVSVYSVRDTNVASGLVSRPADAALDAFRLRGSADGTVLYFSRPVDFRLSDSKGRTHRSGRNAAWADLKGLQRGRYFLTVPGAGSFAVMVAK